VLMLEEPLVKMESICKFFGPVRALDKVDFYVGRSEIVGLVGDNGAGKSTLVKVLSGIYPPDEGRIYLEGRRVEFSSPSQARMLGIETIYQDLALVEDLPIYRNIFLGKEPLKRFGIFSILDERKMKEESEKVLKLLKINIRSVDVPVKYLSGGQRQSVAIARAVYYRAKLLLMDEPTTALGAAEVESVLELIRNVKKEGRSIVIISHNLPMILSVCDRVTVLRKGKVVGNKYTKDLTIEELTDMIIGRGKYAE